MSGFGRFHWLRVLVCVLAVLAPVALSARTGAGGTLRGTLTDASTGLPIASTSGHFAQVSVFNATGTLVTSTATDSTGLYEFRNLTPGSYYVRTAGNFDYVDQIHPATTCPKSSCAVLSGTPLVVTEGGVATANFNLVRSGTISGFIRRAVAAPGLFNATVEVVHSSGTSFGSAFPDLLNGNYSMRGLPAGTYYLRTTNQHGLVDEVFDNIPCPNCTDAAALSGTPVTVTVGATATANFELAAGGGFTGTVTNSSSVPLANVSVIVVNASNVTQLTVTTNSSGIYTASGLPAGTYYARTSNSLGFGNKAYNNKVCEACNAAAIGDPITVTTSGNTGGINFSLTSGGTVSGTIRIDGGSVVQNVTVTAYTGGGASIASANSGSDGRYSITGLSTGTVFLKTSNSSGLLDELYNNIPCHVSCDVATGTGVAVVAGSTTNGIDFGLIQGGVIGGTVTNASTTAGVAAAVVSFYTSSGVLAGSATTNGSGAFQSSALAAGSYFALTTDARGLIPQLYNQIPCLNCGPASVVAGSAIVVTAGNLTSGIHFPLSPGGSITGSVRGLNNAPIAGAQIDVYSASGVRVAGAQSGSGGTFSVAGLPTGSYRVRTDVATLNYPDLVYATPVNLPCQACDVTLLGAPVAVTAPSATGGVDFVLDAGGTIAGTVTDASATPLAGIEVQAVDAADRIHKRATTNALGQYSLAGLAQGGYYLRTNTNTHVNQVYNGVACVACNILSGTETSVISGQTVTGRNFTLQPGGRVQGTVTNASNAPIANVVVTLTTRGGVPAGTATTNSTGQYQSPALPAGVYYARTSNTQGYVNEVFDNLACAPCLYSGTGITVAVGSTSTADFSLIAGGRITGTVTDVSTTSPISGASVLLYAASGQLVETMTTNASGTYSTTVGLPPGNYYAYFEAPGYIPEIYNDLLCVSCSRNSGQPIVVSLGATTTGINTALSAGGRITGRITSAVSSLGLQGVTVTIFNKVDGRVAGTATTDVTGAYTAIGMPVGTLTARTTNALGFIDEWYDNVPCATCEPSSGTGIVVTAGGTTTAINFVLDLGGRISGTVRNAASAGVPDVHIGVYDNQNRLVTEVTTTQLGTYTTIGLTAGRYYLKTLNNLSGLMNVLYLGVPCQSCAATSGTGVDVTAGSTRSGIDFTLPTGATISGTVRDTSNQPIADVTVNVFRADGSSVGSAQTSAAGQYSVPALAAGTHYVRTFNRAGFVDRIYNDIECVLCGPASGTPVPVATGATVTVDFALPRGGSISGRVTGTAGVPLAGVALNIYAANGSLIHATDTNADGVWTTTAGLPPGNYWVRTVNALNYVDEAYDDLSCAQCDPLLGTAVAVTGTFATTGINFALTPGSFITGTVAALDGSPIADVVVKVFTGAGVQVSSSLSNARGEYRSVALAPGTYYLRTENSYGYTDQLYGGRECLGCNPSTGTAVVVVTGSDRANINFALLPGFRITGTVKSSTNVPIVGATVRVYDGYRVEVANGITDGTGTYSTTTGLPVGQYYARSSNDSGYVDRIYDIPACSGCLVTTGTPIVMATATVTGINFSLDTGGRLSGTLTDASTTQGIPSATVSIYSSTGELVDVVTTGSGGQYISSGLAAGAYFVKASSNAGHISQLHQGVACVVCSVLGGTPVTVSSGSTVTGIDFALVPGGRITGRVGRNTDPIPLVGVSVQIFNGSNTLVTTATTDANGIYVTGSGLPVGTYYLRTSNTQGYVDKVHGTVNCLACLPNAGLAVTLAPGVSEQRVDFILIRGARISGTVTAQSTGAPLSGSTVHIHDTAGKIVSTAITDNAGAYLTPNGLPPGDYYARTASIAGYLDAAYRFFTCVACDVRLATRIPVSGTAVSTGIDFAVLAGTAVGGRVTAAGTGQTLSNVVVDFYSTSGSLVASATTNASGTFSTFGIAPGVYHLRTTNVQGYIDEAFGDFACAPCNILGSTPVTISASRSDLDFVLNKGGLISGYVFDSNTNAPLSGATVSFYNGGVFVGRTAPTSASGYYAISLPVGTYTAVTDAVNGYASSGTSSRLVNGRVVASATGSITVGLGTETTGVALGLAACTPPVFTIDALTRGVRGVSYSRTVTASGGTGTRTFALASGTLAPGLSLSAAGVLSGVPTVAGSANFTLAVTDGNGCAGTQAFILTVEATTPLPARAPFGQVDTPVQGATGVAGAIGITGWAVDDTGIQHVRIYRNCLSLDLSATCQRILGTDVVFIGEATMVAGARPDVEAAFAAYPGVRTAGWGLEILTNLLPHQTNGTASGGQGTMTFYTLATDVDGVQAWLGRSYDSGSALFVSPTVVTLANDTITRPFGTIDTPASGATVSGQVANFGWVLTPDVNITAGDPTDILMPVNGSTIVVYIDGVPRANVTYNQCRGTVGNPVGAAVFCNDDVANTFGNLFPLPTGSLRSTNPTRYRNLDAGRSAIGSYVFNSLTLPNGLHTIAWGVQDSAGRSQGIGSRFFTVANTGTDEPLVDESAVPRGDAAPLARLSVSDTPVWSRTGFRVTGGWAATAASPGEARTVRIGQMGRMELWFGADVDAAFLVVNGTLRDLPVGSTLEGQRFSWAPGPAYLGTYSLVFIVGGERVEVTVTVGDTGGDGGNGGSD
jgi:protocatechuate 3,4-dioxygenase beta subunit